MQRNAAANDSLWQPPEFTTRYRNAARRETSTVPDSPCLLAGLIVRSERGGPIARALVEIDGHHDYTDADGVYCLQLERRSGLATLQVSAPGFRTCVETIDLAISGPGGLMTRNFRLVTEEPAPTPPGHFELDRFTSARSRYVSVLPPPRLEPMIDQVSAGSPAQASSGSRRTPDRAPSPDDFDLAFERELSCLFDTGLESDLDMECFGDEDGYEILSDDDLNDDEQILFAAGLDEWDPDTVELDIAPKH